MTIYRIQKAFVTERKSCLPFSFPMIDHTANNKRIAKNTLLLYFRMLLIMAVTLYTSRVVLATLGVEDFGIYNVVGGVVAMFSVLSASLSSAISRFITYELGKGDKKRLMLVFSSSVIIQTFLAFIIGVLAEIGGIWFLNNKMNIPVERMSAANWVLQCSILTFMVNLVSVPYNAAIIAHERMKVFAYVGILEAVLKLVVVFALRVTMFDRLEAYAVMLVLVAILIRLIYGHYCKRHFEECTFHAIYDKSVLKEIGGFAGWNFIGSSSAIMRDHGGNIVLNLFCGPAVNAARGIATQVSSAVQSFANNFMTALNPQITKSYATGNQDYMMTLIFKGARFSFYLLLLLSIPVLANTRYVLALWLNVVPEHTVLFVRLILLFCLSESISTPLITAQHATGKIRDYQLIVGGLQMMNLPISYIILRMGCFPESIIVVAIVISQCCLAARLVLLRKMIGLRIRMYLRRVYLNVLAVMVTSSTIPFLLSIWTKESFLTFIYLSLFSVAITLAMIYLIGFSHGERVSLKRKISTIKTRVIRK